MAGLEPSGQRKKLIQADNIWKYFGSVAVLKGVDLTLETGQIHALLGGNGAGKSTLMRIIAGLHHVDQGDLYINGEHANKLTPVLSRQLGIHLVPQEPMLFPNLSIEENVLMNMKGNRSELHTRLIALIKEVGANLDLQSPAGQLEVADQQMVEILRGLIRDASILILDEPTSALTPREVNRLFERMRALTAQGVGIFFISHKLNEIREIADIVSILRDGKVVMAGPPKTYTDPEIVRAMTHVEGGTGNVLGDRHQAESYGEPVLEVKDLCGEGFAHLSFSIKAGEVLGLAGVVGSGRTELAETIYGIRKVARGKVLIAGEDATHTSPQMSLDMGLVYLPEDRQSSGLFVNAPLSWNASSLVLYREPAWLQVDKEEIRFQEYVKKLGIVCSDSGQAVKTLSGGNQQKILLAKCLAAKPRVLILDEPTRGVDVAVRADIYRIIDELATSGVAILLISSDHDEVQRLSQRVLTMAHGHPAGMLEGKEITVDAIAQMSFGVNTEEVKASC
ncbi:autoinducer 2 ABC transporter ATP-binding protein LsrA [Cohaesibacter celericrescens]|uniref:Autoinducer 2 import ATP-binding protein LsrA n=1 Tax=Cohaesibacter celericrescens TaxID=2067669 RepID=A0A2N5XLM1_9HYPH|nr:autoinducer 2 ABC transporter ATP-binding protein LsrA [Cohaesibacter celericrescens]PLW75436.1 autoinducer 2 ABC transporter ATP-binding protein LsrA [Cohaesibacter celericrescens]